MGNELKVDPAGLTAGATAVDAIAQELHVNIAGVPVWADYLSVAGCSGASEAIRVVSTAMATQFTDRAGALQTSADNYTRTDTANGAHVRTVQL